MQRSDFNFDLPPQLIAQHPTAKRSASRLLCLNRATGVISDKYFHQLVDMLSPGDLLVMNNTRVIPARFFARKVTGGQVEILVERLLDSHRCLAHVRASKSPKPGGELITQAGMHLKVIQRHDQLFELELAEGQTFETLLGNEGHMPLPPYIARADNSQDSERYQTVYATQPGAVAAPTAGLHFDAELLQQLQGKGVDNCYVTLHVGAGTFQPVRVDDIKSHKMHSERLVVTESVCKKVRDTKARGGRVIAVGTTSVRSLESASQTGTIRPMDGETDIFLYPGKRFNTVDAMITNFHLPESTLLMLVCAFAGRDNTFAAYQHAIAQGYRFYSYGDAMFIYTDQVGSP